MKTLLKIIVVLLAVGCVIGGWFWFEFGPSIRDARKKEAAFRALGPEKFDKLIELACTLEKKGAEAGYRAFGGHGQAEVPAEFRDYGFDGLEIRSGVVEGRVYWLVDSGGFACIDTKAVPLRVLFVRGDSGDINEVLYEKKGPN